MEQLSIEPRATTKRPKKPPKVQKLVTKKASKTGNQKQETNEATKQQKLRPKTIKKKRCVKKKLRQNKIKGLKFVSKIENPIS
jgi:hypothetical protein